jgi:hypothetical protein
MTPKLQSRFNELLGALDYPMFIATTCDDAGARAGCLIGFATQSLREIPRALRADGVLATAPPEPRFGLPAEPDPGSSR